MHELFPYEEVEQESSKLDPRLKKPLSKLI